MMKRAKKPKKIPYELIERGSVVGHPMYTLLDALIAAHHNELRDARIALAWNLSWKPDVDGRVTLGKCRKASDLDRELAAFDFVILIRKSFWQHPSVSEIQRTALLDHELCHAALKHDANGEPVEDERGRRVYRTKKHSIEEFTEIVARYGMWTSELEHLAAALRQAALAPFAPCDRCRETPGFNRESDLLGGTRMVRCPCFLTWAAQREELEAEKATA